MDLATTNTDLWTYDLENESAKRLTFDPAIDSTPLWSPDATKLVFTSDRAQKFNLYVKNADGSQEEQLISQEGPDRYPLDWSARREIRDLSARHRLVVRDFSRTHGHSFSESRLCP